MRDQRHGQRRAVGPRGPTMTLMLAENRAPIRPMIMLATTRERGFRRARHESRSTISLIIPMQLECLGYSSLRTRTDAASAQSLLNSATSVGPGEAFRRYAC